MKNSTIAFWILLAGLILLIPLSGVALEEPAEKAPPQKMVKDKQGIENDMEKQVRPGAKSNKKQTATKTRMPEYKPPRRGAPAGRLAGGTRGTGDRLPFVCVLSPEHIGLTTREQPSLYWFISQPTSYPIEFTIIPSWGIRPLLETPLKPPVQPGVQSIRLVEYDVRLEPGVKYKWFVALVPNGDRRSKDIITGGEIELIKLSEALRARLKQANKAEAVHIYAEAGIWYEALTFISELIEDAPDNSLFRKQRASLLRQVGLPQVSQYDMKHVVPGG